MADDATEQTKLIVDEVYRTQSRRVYATLVRLLGDFDLAEEALHEAFIAAVEQWGATGVPANPVAWLVSAGRFKAIDTIRRRVRFDSSLNELATRFDEVSTTNAIKADTEIEDDRLRLIFTCCHPAVAASAQVPLTLREVCGLTTEAIASAFLTAPATLAQRIVRAKNKIREAKVPYEVPTRKELPDRLETVLQVVYLVFNEGYSASSGDTHTRPDLSGEAIRLGRLLLELLCEPEVQGLLALMLLHESRRAARTSPTGEIILLEDQDRSLWNRAQIEEGKSLVEQALASRAFGSFTIQAAIVAVHADARSAAETDWDQIVRLYDLLLRMTPSPVIELNRAVALAMRDGPPAGLAVIDELLGSGQLAEYHLAYAARADLCRRMGAADEALQAYRQALELARQEPERRFLQGRIAELE
jgi:RNA polymerase sigma-70 factor (ECF subfamily)